VATRQRTGKRAKDDDRTKACQVLDSALGDGQLSMEEHRQRVAAATTASTLGELQSLVDDLQTGNAPVRLPTLNGEQKFTGSGWGMGAAVAGVLVALGIGIGWGLYGNTSSPLDFTSDPGAKPDDVAPVVLTPPRQLHSLGGLSGLFTQMQQKFGDTTGYRLVVYPDYASLERPDPGEDRRKLNYSYRGGWDDPSSTSRSDSDVVVDLSKFDQKAVVGILRGAPETLGIKPADVTSTYLIVDPSGDPTTPGAVSISMYVSSDYGSGSIDVNPDGSTKRVSYPS
jgi:Domain of unknown function (DUF1707)